MSKPAGVILAGGRGTRLGGVVKATIVVDNQRLIDLVAETLNNAGLEPLIVSAGAFSPVELEPPEGFVAIPDPDGPIKGPVAGLLAATDYLQKHSPETVLLLTAAVDAPFVPERFATDAVAALSPDSAVIYGSWHGQIYPTNALWRLSMLHPLLQAPTPEIRGAGLKDLFPPHLCQTLDADPAAPNPYFNINSPGDLADAERIYRNSRAD